MERGDDVRALVITNMYPTPAHPARGRFVADQVRALQQLDGVEVELHAFAPGGVGAYLASGRDVRRRYRGTRFDIVHAHFGLTSWPALGVRARARVVTLHGTDLAHPRSRALTLGALPLMDLAAVVSDELARRVPRWANRGRAPAVLPCGVDLDRFHPIDRSEARSQLGLPAGGRYLLFPADPARPEKRHDRALALADAVGARLLTLGDVDPDRVPLFVNAVDAVTVTSEREGFGLAALEALACDVPVLSTPHGVAPEALGSLPGAYCGPFDLVRWRTILTELLTAGDLKFAGRAAAEPYSSVAMADRVAGAWRRLLT